MKYLVAVVVFVILFILPFGSWVYLQSGLNYRKAALRDLEPKGMFTHPTVGDADFASRTTLLQLEKVEQPVMPRIYEQYGGSHTFQIVSLEKSDKNHSNWIALNDSLTAMLRQEFKEVGFMLIDTAMQIRNTYPATMEGLKTVIEHTSIILPRVKEVDIKLKK